MLAADDKTAGGVFLQKMPAEGGKLPADYDPEGWQRLTMFAGTVKSAELLTLSPEDINRRLFWKSLRSSRTKQRRTLPARALKPASTIWYVHSAAKKSKPSSGKKALLTSPAASAAPKRTTTPSTPQRSSRRACRRRRHNVRSF